MKQLELARQAALPTKPSSDNVVALSVLPQRRTDNKYELVIEHILAAFQEHPLFGTNFHADMKQSEETYLASLCTVDYILQSLTSSSSLACPDIWGRRYIWLFSSSMVPCLLYCPLSAPPPSHLSYTHLPTLGLTPSSYLQFDKHALVGLLTPSHIHTICANRRLSRLARDYPILPVSTGNGNSINYTLWRWVFFSRQKLMIATSQTIFSLERTRLKTKPTSLMRQSLTQRLIVGLLHGRPSVSSTVCPVRMQVTWCYYAYVVLL